MKKLLLFGIVFLTFAVLVNAQDNSMDEEGPDYTGAPAWDFIKDQLPFTERLAIAGQPLTVVNGALCSTDADWSRQSVINANSICWVNENGGSPGGQGVEHLGVAYQVFNVDPWFRVDEIFVSAGERGCVPITAGTEYYRQAFYCDDTSQTCTNFHSVCTDGETTLRARTCMSPGGSTFEEVVVVNWFDANAPACSATCDFPDPSDKSDCVELQTKVSSGLCVAFDVIDCLRVCSDCVVGEELSGSWSDVRIPTNVKAGENFVVRAKWTADVSGLYLLEAGIFDRQLTVFTAEGSKCDDSKQFSGRFLNVPSGHTVDVLFNIEAVSSPGMKTVIVGAYTQCFDRGGEEVQIVHGQINVLGEGGAVGGRPFFTLAFMVGGALIGSGLGPIGVIVGGVAGAFVGLFIFGGF